ncbi:hypothetical protein GJ633_10500 [Halorubrum sp. CBA1125]|uniref:site-specific integrase n=1 Tax=Halorubrum sp. CBA1125 TaxID=2668072 RepID=UPI0012E903B3|nr:hypothetical protein [Halorubrum sp. CBA1125]
MSDSTLEPIAPEEAVRLYLRDRRTDLAEETIESYRYKLTRFIEWCEQEDVDNLNELSGRSLLEFKQSRSEDLNPVSLKGQLDTLRSFIRFCESIDAVETDLHNKVLSLTLNQGDRERDVLVDPETVTDVLQHLSRFDYASSGFRRASSVWRLCSLISEASLYRRCLTLKDAVAVRVVCGIYDTRMDWMAYSQCLRKRVALLSEVTGRNSPLNGGSRLSE